MDIICLVTLALEYFLWKVFFLLDFEEGLQFSQIKTAQVKIQM
jgi:hypothetical protein